MFREGFVDFVASDVHHSRPNNLKEAYEYVKKKFGEDAAEVMKMIQTDTGFALNPYVEGKGAVQDFVPAPVR